MVLAVSTLGRYHLLHLSSYFTSYVESDQMLFLSFVWSDVGWPESASVTLRDVWNLQVTFFHLKKNYVP